MLDEPSHGEHAVRAQMPPARGAACDFAPFAPPQPSLHRAVIAFVDELERREGLTLYVPAMASTDVRQDGRGRVCVVDPNRFPQGFNNVEGADIDRAGMALGKEMAALPEERRPTRLHIVEERYGGGGGGEDLHPYYGHLSALQRFVQVVGSGLPGSDGGTAEVTSSANLAVPGDVHGVSDAARSVLEHLGGWDRPGVVNILNTSYPSDLVFPTAAGHAPGDSSEQSLACDMCTERFGGGARCAAVEAPSGGDAGAGGAPASRRCSHVPVDHDDPRLYNSLRKHELFTSMHTWLLEFLALQRVRFLHGLSVQDSVPCDEAPEDAGDADALAAAATDLRTSLDFEARFDTFPGSVGSFDSRRRKIFCDIITRKLRGDQWEMPWEKVFVKDDDGSNGVGICVFSEKDLANGGGEERSKGGGRTLRTTHESLKTLRGRNSGKHQCFVLQEGVPTSLLKYDPATGAAVAQLEVVLMFLKGRIFSYFLREVGFSVSAPTAKTPGPDSPPDLCVSLNLIASQHQKVSFVKRCTFESDPAYAEAYAQVREVWWKYELVGRLACLALAKQAKVHCEAAQQGRGGWWAQPARAFQEAPVATGGSERRTAAHNRATEASAPERAKKRQENSGPRPESAEAFSRRVTGTLSKALNQTFRGPQHAPLLPAARTTIKEMQQLLQQRVGRAAPETRTDIEQLVHELVQALASDTGQGFVALLSDAKARMEAHLTRGHKWAGG